MSQTYLTNEQFEDWKNLKGNFTEHPTYIDLVVGLWNVMSWYYRPSMWNNYHFPQTFLDDFLQNFVFPIDELYYIILIAIVFTLVRYLFEKFLCQPVVNWLNLKAIDKKKLPESAWKCVFYTCTWLYCNYLLHYRYTYFREPYLIWDDWTAIMTVPFDIKVMYFIQCGFYLHSIYATVYMDHKRKDFYVMLIHHVLTMTLILVSYATRYHKIGLLVLFVHDITDIWLELTKVLHYLAERADGRQCRIWEMAATGCFIMFTLTWFLFRLYWYPMKVLYTAGVVPGYRAYGKGCGLYGFFNALLWLLLGMNLYWLFFILQFLVRVCRGTLSNLHDVREEDDDEVEADAKSASSTVDQRPVNDITDKKKI